MLRTVTGPRVTRSTETSCDRSWTGKWLSCSACSGEGTHLMKSLLSSLWTELCSGLSFLMLVEAIGLRAGVSRVAIFEMYFIWVRKLSK